MQLEPAPALRDPRTAVRADSRGPDAARETRKGSDAEVAAAADAHCASSPRPDEFSGVVLIARNGKPFFHKAYGMADRDFGVPNRPDTKFNLGSINKVVHAGRDRAARRAGQALALRHDPQAPAGLSPRRPPTRSRSQQLVTMTSGLGDFFGETFDATPKSRIRTLADFLALFAIEPLLFEPGTSRRYSNAGLRRARPDHREGLGQELLRLRARAHLRAGRNDGHRLLHAGRGGRRTGPSATRARTPDGKRLPGPSAPTSTRCPRAGSSAGGGYSTAGGPARASTSRCASDKLLSPAWTDWYFSDHAPAPAGRRRAPAKLARRQGSRRRHRGRQRACSRSTSTPATRSSCCRTSIRPRPKRSRRRCASGSGSTERNVRDSRRIPALDAAAQEGQRPEVDAVRGEPDRDHAEKGRAEDGVRERVAGSRRTSARPGGSTSSAARIRK